MLDHQLAPGWSSATLATGHRMSMLRTFSQSARRVGMTVRPWTDVNNVGVTARIAGISASAGLRPAQPPE